MGANLLTLLLYAGLGVVLFFLPFNLIQVQGYSATAAGAALLPFILCMSLLSRWSGKLVDRFGSKLPLTVDPLITAGGLLLYTRPSVGGSYWLTFFPAVLVMGIGMATNVAPLTTTVMNAVSEQQAGTASGVNNAVSRLANLLSVALLGLLMIAVFRQQLQANLIPLELPADIMTTLLANSTDLAAMSLPEGLSVSQADTVTGIINRAFVTAFRTLMVCSAVLAVASSAVAWGLLDKPAKN